MVEKWDPMGIRGGVGGSQGDPARRTPGVGVGAGGGLPEGAGLMLGCMAQPSQCGVAAGAFGTRNCLGPNPSSAASQLCALGQPLEPVSPSGSGSVPELFGRLEGAQGCRRLCAGPGSQLAFSKH